MLNLHTITTFPPLSSPQTLILISLLTLILAHIIKNLSTNPNPRPPGPRGLPIIGNLHQLGGLPHRSLRRLAGVHGPLMLLRLGQIPTIIVSSSSLAKEILQTHDLKFCSRPALATWQKLSYGGLDVAFGGYSDQWRQLRKLTVVEFYNSKRVLSFLQRARAAELDALVADVASKSASNEGVNLSDAFLRIVTNVICKAAFGDSFSTKRGELDELIMETIALMGGFVAGDFFPCMQYVMNVACGAQRRMEKNFREMDGFLDRELREKERVGVDGDDFASVLLRMHGSGEGVVSRDCIKAVLMDIFIAGSDTAAQVLVWTMTELIRNPKILTKVQLEVRQIINDKDKIEETDLPRLKYLNLVIKESFRLHPPGPILLPRECREACKIGSYLIPEKTRVYINAWAIGRDSNIWDNAKEFRPERFKDSGIDYKGQHFELIPFGGGRRICPGLTIADNIIGLTLANLLYRFDWTLPKGIKNEDVDMTECFGIVVCKKVPLVLIPKQAQVLN